YLPLAASHAPLINWGNPRSLQEIWWHVTGKQYQVFLAFGPTAVGEHLAEFGSVALREFGSWWLPLVFFLAITGLAQVFKHDRPIFWFLTVVVIADHAYPLRYYIVDLKSHLSTPI